MDASLTAPAEERPREPWWQRRDLHVTAALFFLALLPRLYVALAWPREPVWDGHYYDFGARRIAEGFGYSDDSVIGGVTVWHPWCHYPVGYSAFLAFFYRIFGAGPRVGTVANAFVGALTAVVVYRLARHATTEARSRVAGALTALNPGLIAYTALLMTEPLAAFGILLAAWLYVRDKQRPLRAGLIAGVVLGLSTLVRPPSILLAPALFFFTDRAPGTGIQPVIKRLRGPLTATLLAFVTVLPWTARNCKVMDGCAFVSTNAGWNLMIGAFPRATGRFETVRATDGCPVVTGQVEQDRCWQEAGIAHIKADPLRWLGLAPKKLGYTFDHESFPMGYLGEANPNVWTEERKATGREILGVSHRLLLFFAALAAVSFPSLRIRGEDRARLFQWLPLAVVVALGVIGFVSDNHSFWPLAAAAVVIPCLPLPGAPPRWGATAHMVALLASVAVIAIVFFGEDRYHMVASPALCLLAACALRRPMPREAR